MKNLSIKQLLLAIVAIGVLALVLNPCAGVNPHEAGLCELYYPSVNFTCYVLFVWWLVSKYAVPALRDRKINFELSFNKSSGLLREAEAHLHEAQVSLKHFEAERNEIIERLKREGAQTSDAIVRRAEESAEGIIRDRRRQIEKTQTSAAEEVRQAVVAKAMGRARKSLTERLSNEDDRRLRQEVIDSLFR
jgi:F0F1-type ATP synthase membrane subunit b/b'